MKTATSIIFMWIAVCISLLLSCFFDLGLLNFVAEISGPLHQFCQEVTPNSNWKTYYNAILCGEKLPATQSHNFRTTGIYHLMVVSGMHLVFCEFWLCKTWPSINKPPKWMIFSCLLIYTSMSLWNPPVLRALLHWIFRNLNQYFHLGHAPHDTSFIVGIFGICLFPELAYSASYQLSWLASLAIHFNYKQRAVSYVWVYIILFPLVSNWGTAHPFSIAINFFLTPVLGIIMLPLSFLACVAPITSSFVDGFWQLLLKLMHFLSTTLSLELLTSPLSFSSGKYIWVYLGIIQMILALKRRWRTLI